MNRILLIQEALRDAKQIASLDKTEGHSHSGDAYANALGRANGIAKGIVIKLEYLLEQTEGGRA